MFVQEKIPAVLKDDFEMTKTGIAGLERNLLEHEPLHMYS